MNVNKIYELFAEEAFRNAIECTVSGNLQINGPTPIYLQRWDIKAPLFSYTHVDNVNKSDVHEELITLNLCESIELRPIDPPSFNYLFWIEPKGNGKDYFFKYLECGSVTPLPHLDIAFDDTTKIAFGIADSDTLKRNCMNNYVFDAGKYKLLFVKSWQNGAQNWNLFGIRSGREKDIPRKADVALEDNGKLEKVRVIKKEFFNKVRFPNQFDEIDILAYESVDFVDIGEAQAARDALIDRRHRGDALISLWEEYSKMELELAKEESDELGRIKYQFDSSPKYGQAFLNMTLDPDQTCTLRRLAEENAQFQLVCDREYPPIVTLTKFNSTLKLATVEDELYQLPSSGELVLSTLGNEIVDKRRRQAIKQLMKTKRIVTQNLWFAIEDEADKMFEDRHQSISPLSKKTEKFLKDKFGIEQLTKNQRDAVEIALNNRHDITVIQGPPGTGKTTVVAAICHRLLELADKKAKDGRAKTILASAFQNDTIEHLASKIYTHGLPTVKVGRKTLGVRAEKVFIKEMEAHLQKEIDVRGGECEDRISEVLSGICVTFLAEKNVNQTLQEISDILPEDSPIEGIDFDRLREIRNALRSFVRTSEKTIRLLESIPTTVEDYNFCNGFSILTDVMESALTLTDNDRKVLAEAPEINPDPSYLDSISRVKTRLIEEMTCHHKLIEDGYITEISNWINDAIKLAAIYEETNYANEDDFIRAVLTDLKKDLSGNTGYIKRSLQEYGETVAATNQIAGSNEMKEFGTIHNVILEEAARSNPLDLLIPMMKAENRIIMVGDQNQLPHLLETEIAERSLAQIEDIDAKKEKRRLYEQSLFGIIFENVKKGKRIRCITLEEQFRMHPTIGEFISNMYYVDPLTGKGKLRPGADNLSETKKHNLSLPWAKDKTMIFCDVNSSSPEGRGKSRYRQAEAEKIMSIMDQLRSDPEFNNLSVGIITFYSRQVSVLFEEAEKHGYVVKTKDGYDVHPNFSIIDGDKERFRIGSVDSFQGKEFDVVILSTVRSNSIPRLDGNEKKVFGFLTLKNRLNVAFSRAKKLVITVGDAKMFSDDYAKKYVPGLYEMCTNITNESYGGRI